MSMIRSYLARLRRDERGASIIEFALLAPLLFALLFGVISVGLYMQNSNAVRSLASDAARFAAVEFQKNNDVSEETLEDNIHAMGTAAPYSLAGSRLEVDVTEIVPARVDGAREFDLDITYSLPRVFGGIAIDNIDLEYSRPLFVLDS